MSLDCIKQAVHSETPFDRRCSCKFHKKCSTNVRRGLPRSPGDSPCQRSDLDKTPHPVPRAVGGGWAVKGDRRRACLRQRERERASCHNQSRITCEKAWPLLHTSLELPACITHRHTSPRSGNSSEQQLPPSGPTCWLLTVRRAAS